MSKRFIRLAAAAALVLSTGPALAQVQNIDPNSADGYQPAGSEASEAPEANPAEQSEWTSTESAETPASAATEPAAPTASPATAQGATVAREDLFSAAEGVFGRGAQGLGGILERILRDQGEPVAYIAGREAGGAFVFGVRYGSGTMRHRVEGDRPVYWTGPSLGFDFGADANKVFVLVYNLHDSQDLFKRYAGAEGRAYVVGGFTAQYLQRRDVVLIPIRLGVGLRLGINTGYMRFSERNRWLPF